MMFVTTAVLDTFVELQAYDGNFAEKRFVRDVFLRISRKDAEQLFQRTPYLVSCNWSA